MTDKEMSRDLCFFVPSNRVDKRGCPLGMDGLNEIIRQARGNRFGAARSKTDASEHVATYAKLAAHEQGWSMPKGHCSVVLSFVEPSTRRDPDNIFAGAKYILDGLTARSDTGAGVIRDDSQRCITLRCVVADHIDKEHPGVWVRIKED